MKSQPGRNDPCPCGSGKKYKKCCLQNSTNPAQEIREALQDEMQGQEFSSLEEVNEFARAFMERRNNAPDDSFQGLSSSEMHRLLHFPFESPYVVSFDFDAVKSINDAPVLRLLILIAEAIGDEGLKPTAKGNLPRAAARSIAKEYLSEETHQRLTHFGEFAGEEDVPDLQVVRLIAMKAGFIRKFKGKFIVTKKCRDLINRYAWAQIFESLFKTFIREFNWAYPRSIIEEPFLQHSFAFTLYMLQKFGNQPRPDKFYADRFIEAFPMICNGIPDTEYFNSEERVKNAYISQVLFSFGEKFGLLKSEFVNRDSVITVLPLTYSLVGFQNR